GRVNTRGAVYHLFAPEVLEDFPEIETEIRSCRDILIHTAQDSTPPVLHHFSSIRGEIRHVFGQIEDLLRRGVPWDQIAISAVDLEAILPHVQREARLRGLPLNPRLGRPLAETAGAAVFTGLIELGGTQMGYAAVRDFALHGGIPFANPDVMRALAAFGRRWRCWGRFGRLDLWEQAFSRAKYLESEFGAEGSFFAAYPDADLTMVRDAYQALRAVVRGVHNAGSMAELRARFFSWYNEWINADGWDPAGERELQSALEVLGNLIRLESRVEIVVSSPIRVFVEMLADTVYLQAGGRGVPVYPYRVAAGGCIPYHFVINLHQDGIEVLSGGIGFLREDQQEALELKARDNTVEFLRAYSAYGSNYVWFSGNAGISGGIHAVPALYLEPEYEGLVQETEPEPGSERLEMQWWAAAETDAPPRLSETLLHGVEHFSVTRKTGSEFDFTRRPAAAGTRDKAGAAGKAGPDPAAHAEPAGDALVEAIARRYTQNGRWTASAASLRAMTANPAAVLLQRIFGLDDDDWEPSWQTAMDMGNVYHTALERLIGPETLLGNHQGPLDPEVICTEVDRVIEELKGYIALQTRLTELETGYELAVMRRTLIDLLPHIDPVLDGAAAAAVEYEIMEYDEEYDLLWKGRIDRLDRIAADGRSILYDYKRKRVPAAGELRPGRIDDSDPFPVISEPQMAVYLRWAWLTGTAVASARYVGILQREAQPGRKVSHVVLEEDMHESIKAREGRLPRLIQEYQDPELAELFAALGSQSREYRRRFIELDFSIPVDRTRFQNSSAFRQITRHRYRVR
ncbi:MAG: PD-(D/E)XK nuclease family protein, partial [Spirochaeta sp.]